MDKDAGEKQGGEGARQRAFRTEMTRLTKLTVYLRTSFAGAGFWVEKQWAIKLKIWFYHQGPRISCQRMQIQLGV